MERHRLRQQKGMQKQKARNIDQALQKTKRGLFRLKHTDNKSPREKTRANKQQDIHPAKLLHAAFEAKHRGEDIDIMDHKGTRTERLI